MESSTHSARKSQGNSCVLCGSSDSQLVPFYLRTMSGTSQGTTITTRWRNYKAECCAACFDRVSRLQRMKLAMNVIGFGPMFLIGLILIASKDAVSGAMLAFPFVTMIVGLIGLGVVGMKRRQLIRTPHFAATMEMLKSIHRLTTRDTRIRVIPLATVSQSDSVFESER